MKTGLGNVLSRGRLTTITTAAYSPLEFDDDAENRL